MIHLEENEEASFINEHELEQCQTPQDKDLFFPRCSSQFHEFLLHEEEEEESRHPSLEDLTQSILDYQNLINDEKPLSQTILPILEQNNEYIDVVSIPMRFIGEKKGEHPLNYKFNGTRIIDLQKDYDASLTVANESLKSILDGKDYKDIAKFYSALLNKLKGGKKKLRNLLK